MKQVVVTGPNAVTLREVPVPEPGPGQVLVKVMHCLICATDIEIIRGDLGEDILQYPATPGHEWSGVVTAAHDPADQWLVGKRIVAENRLGCGACEYCRRGQYNVCVKAREVGFHLPGAYAEYLVTWAKNALVLPDHLTFEQACFIEPISVALHGLTTVGIEPGDRVVVCGAGQIGLFSVQLARLMGATQVIQVDLDDARLQVGQSLGANEVINLRHQDADARLATLEYAGPDVVIETSGSIQGIAQALRWVKRGGRILLLGVYKLKELPIQPDAIVLRNLTIYGAVASPRVWERSLRLLAGGRIQTSPLLTHRYPLEQYAEALAAVRDRAPGLIKAILEIGNRT